MNPALQTISVFNSVTEPGLNACAAAWCITYKFGCAPDAVKWMVNQNTLDAAQKVLNA